MKTKFSLIFPLLLFFVPVFAQTQVEICFQPRYADSETVFVDVFLTSEEAILGQQFSVGWDSSILQFEQISYVDTELLRLDIEFLRDHFGLPGDGNVPEDRLTMVWDAPGANAVSFSNILVFTIQFKITGNLPQIFPVALLGNPTAIQFVSGEGEIVTLNYEARVCTDLARVDGAIRLFDNADCNTPFGIPDWRGWTVIATSPDYIRHASIYGVGQYSMLLPEGDYQLVVVPPADLWMPCESETTLRIIDPEINYEADLGLYPSVDCPELMVDLSTPLMLRCFDNQYICTYCNIGTVRAEETYIEIQFDEGLEPQSSDLPWTLSADGSYRFDTGDLQPGECGEFTIDFLVSCENELGATHCSEARIYPRSSCKEPSAQWSGASIQVDGDCTGDSLQFFIRNVGEADMLVPLNYVVIEDVVMFNSGTFQLNSGETMPIRLPATGSTYRVEAPQVAFHPGQDMPSLSIEGCSTSGGPTSQGLVTAFPLNDGDPYLDIDCQQNVGSFDPNDKQAFPKGFDADHKLYPNTEIEYLIRFQNTGTFAAVNVSILDTISAQLDLGTIEPVGSSHPYEFEILENRVIKFDFPEIWLPDSTSNEPESHGFIKFRISQLDDLKEGTRIENRAGIYFDFNEPVITNTVFHTIFTPIVLRSIRVNTDEETIQDPSVELYPNPTTTHFFVEIDRQVSLPVRLELLDRSGRRVLHEQMSEFNAELSVDDLPAGLYFYRLTNESGLQFSGKLNVQ